MSPEAQIGPLAPVGNSVFPSWKDSLSGNARANRLTSNAGDNVLTGGAGADIVQGGANAFDFHRRSGAVAEPLSVLICGSNPCAPVSALHP